MEMAYGGEIFVSAIAWKCNSLLNKAISSPNQGVSLLSSKCDRMQHRRRRVQTQGTVLHSLSATTLGKAWNSLSLQKLVKYNTMIEYDTI